MTENTTKNSKASGENGIDFTRLGSADLFDILADRSFDDPELTGIAPSVPEEVASLLETAQMLRGLELPPAQTAFRVVLRGKLLTQLALMPQPLSLRERVSRQWQSQTRAMRMQTIRLAVAVVTVLVFALTSAGTAYAAQSALPGDLLYGVKTGIEAVQLALAPAVEDGELYLAFAERRLEEIEALASQDRYDDILVAAQELSSDLSLAAESLDAEQVKTKSSNAVNALLAVLAKAPPQARPAIEAALIKIADRQGIPVEIPTQTETPETSETPEETEETTPGDDIKTKKPTKTPKDKPEKTVEAPGQLKKTPEAPGLEKKTLEPNKP